MNTAGHVAGDMLLALDFLIAVILLEYPGASIEDIREDILSSLCNWSEEDVRPIQMHTANKLAQARDL